MADVLALPVSLDDLSSCIVNVNLETRYGRKLRVPLYLLSYHEWNEIGDQVPDPVVPRTLVDKAGNKTPNIYDVSYQAKRRKAEEERLYRRLVTALVRAGNRIPGDTFEAQVAAFREKAETGVVNALVSVLVEAAMKGEALIEQRLDTFRDEQLPDDPEPDSDAQAIDA